MAKPFGLGHILYVVFFIIATTNFIKIDFNFTNVN